MTTDTSEYEEMWDLIEDDDDFDDDAELFDDDDDDDDFDDDDDDDAEFFDMVDGLGDDDDDDAEFFRRRRRKRRRRRSKARTARGRGYYKRPASKKLVTQSQLRTATSRIAKDVRRNGAAIKKVDRSARSNRSRLNQQNMVNRKHGKQITALGGRIDQQAQMQMLTTLLEDTSTEYELETAVGGLAAGTKIKLKKDRDMFSLLLPMLVGGGLGGTANAAGGNAAAGPFGDPMTMMMMVLAMDND